MVDFNRGTGVMLIRVRLLLWLLHSLPLALPLLAFAVVAKLRNARVAYISVSGMPVVFLFLFYVAVYYRYLGYAGFTLLFVIAMTSLFLSLAGIVMGALAYRQKTGSAALFLSAGLAGLPFLFYFLFAFLKISRYM